MIFFSLIGGLTLISHTIFFMIQLKPYEDTIQNEQLVIFISLKRM